MIALNDYIYIIVPDGDNGKIKQLKYQCGFDSEPSDSTLKQYYDFSPAPSEAYASCLCYLGPNNPISCRHERRRAYAHQCTMNRIKKENPKILAFSHQKGGWTGFDWNFNNDIRFHVSTNFGYGNSSYFFLKVYYKDYQLTPYSYYVRYRYAEVNEICRYTYSYCVDYRSWPNTIKDAEEFYNAVVYLQDTHVLEWIKNHLEKMLSILDEFIHADQGSYEGNFVEDMRKMKTDTFTGDSWWITKTEKIVGSTDFIHNIRQLPVEVQPELYINRLIEINQRFLPTLKGKNVQLYNCIEALQQQIDNESQLNHYLLYKKLYDKYYYKRSWYSNSNKKKMFRTLLNMHHHLVKEYKYRDLKTEIKKCVEHYESVRKLITEKDGYERTYNFLKSKEDRLISNLESFALEEKELNNID